MEKKGDRKCISRRTPLSPGERLTTEALLSLTHTEDEKTFPLPAEGTETNWTPPRPHPKALFYDNVARVERGLDMERCVGGAALQPPQASWHASL